MSITNFLYNPERKGKQQLIGEFIIRQNILNSIMKDLESSSMKTPEQHYLLVGQRGTGKTTLLHRIKYAIEDSPGLMDWLIPVIFSEEQYNVGELANLWENIAQLLEDYHGFTGLYAEMEKYVSYSNFEERCWDILESWLDRKGKNLVLLIDNIGDLLRKIGELEVRRLRMILQTKPQIRLIAASPLYLESILDYKQPLFEFFKVMRLEGLNKEETLELLLKLADIHHEKGKIERIIKETPERIETLRTLTGGVPRTIALMFNIFIENEHDNSLKDLERILDVVTPLYKHRMDDLKPQQQKIIDAVAKSWDPISVKDLKDKVRLESKVISAQLRQLERNQIVQKMETSTKNHQYILKERFFNIWYLMRYGRRDDKQRVIWLVRFLESWCTDEELERRIIDFVGRIKGKEIDNYNIEFLSEVYSSMSRLNLRSKLLLQESTPPQFGRSLQYTEEEKNKVIQESFSTGDYKKSLQWLSTFGQLTESNKSFVLDISAKLIDDIDQFKTIALDIHDSLIERIENNKTVPLGSLQVYSILGMMGFLLEIKLAITNEDFEKALRVTKSQFLVMAQFVRLLRNQNYFSGFKLEVRLLLLGIRDLYFKGQLNSIMKIFNEGYLEIENGQIPLSEIFNPIYLALNSLGSEGERANLAPEKEEIVKQIVDFIKDKK